MPRKIGQRANGLFAQPPDVARNWGMMEIRDARGVTAFELAFDFRQQMEFALAVSPPRTRLTVVGRLVGADA